jgi:hypothetical protein
VCLLRATPTTDVNLPIWSTLATRFGCLLGTKNGHCQCNRTNKGAAMSEQKISEDWDKKTASYERMEETISLLWKCAKAEGASPVTQLAFHQLHIRLRETFDAYRADVRALAER